MNIIHHPGDKEKTAIIDSLWSHNALYHPVDITPLIISFTDDLGIVKGGLIAQTWWGTLEIQYLWVDEEFRGQGYGKHMMEKVEEEARKRNCHMAYVDTFDFQAKAFYEKLGFTEYGSLSGYAHKFCRHYLSKEYL